jgi:proton-coupled amino acid transporter
MSNELAQKPLTRSKSTTDMQDAVEQERQTDDPVLENVSRPGGFRRYFVDQQQRQNELDDSETSAILGNGLPRYGATASPSPMPMKRTRHFLEFVAVNQYRNLYDSFAGEYLADEDEETTDEESTIGRLIERMPPLSRKHSFVAEKDRASTTKTFFLLLKAVSDQFLQWVNLYIVPRCTNSFVIVCLTVHRIWHSLFAQSVSHEN